MTMQANVATALQLDARWEQARRAIWNTDVLHLFKLDNALRDGSPSQFAAWLASDEELARSVRNMAKLALDELLADRDGGEAEPIGDATEDPTRTFCHDESQE